MKISLYSDLHTEFGNSFPKIPKETDVVILAGDIIGKSGLDDLIGYFRSYPEKQFIYVLGNHEYYNSDWDTCLGRIRWSLESIDNVTLLENESIEIGGVMFHGCTLWTDFMSKTKPFENICKLHAKDSVSDFILIEGVTPDLMHKRSQQSVRWLKNSLEESKDKTNIVITHFPPLLECRHGKYGGGVLDGYFCNDLSDLVSESNITYWLYGHNHWNDYFELYGTRFVSNQYGYPGERVGNEFNESLIIEIN